MKSGDLYLPAIGSCLLGGLMNEGDDLAFDILAVASPDPGGQPHGGDSDVKGVHRAETARAEW